jgi:hypothetical protein
MKKPPEKIDGAKILEWAWSGEQPFGYVRSSSGEIAAEIFGLAICKYEGQNTIYRFSCDKNWKTQQDSDYVSLQEAKDGLPQQYLNILPLWQRQNYD